MAQVAKLKSAIHFIVSNAYYNSLFKGLAVISAEPSLTKLYLDETLCNKDSKMDAGTMMALADITSSTHCMARGCHLPLSFAMNVRTFATPKEGDTLLIESRLVHRKGTSLKCQISMSNFHTREPICDATHSLVCKTWNEEEPSP